MPDAAGPKPSRLFGFSRVLERFQGNSDFLNLAPDQFDVFGHKTYYTARSS